MSHCHHKQRKNRTNTQTQNRHLHASHGRTSVQVPLPLPTSKLQAEKTEPQRARPEVAATAVDENVDAAPPAGCQRNSEAERRPSS